MRKITFEKNLIKIKAYAKAHNVKIRINKSRNPSNDEFDYKNNIVSVSGDQSYAEIISALLHELGHHYDSIHFPELFHTPTNKVVLNKKSNIETITDKINAKRLEIAEKETDTRLKKALLNYANSKRRTPNQKKLITAHKKTLSRWNKRFFGDVEKIFYAKFKISKKEKNSLLDLETRAWDFGVLIARQYKIQLGSYYTKERITFLNTYKKNI